MLYLSGSIKGNRDPMRIIPIGLGEECPNKFLDSLTGKIIPLTEKYIAHSNPESIDNLNQLNRRTEGVIDRMNFSINDPKAPESYLLFIYQSSY